VDEEEVVVVVVIGCSTIISIKLVHTPLDFTLIVDVKSGTKAEEYPDSKLDLLTPLSKADTYPSRFEYKSNGPESLPAIVNVINTVIIYMFKYKELLMLFQH